MSPDLRPLLDEWPFDEHHNVRKVRDGDGHEKIQVRVQEGPFQGLLQMELEGRPDGRQPHGQPYALDHWRQQLQDHLAREGTTRGFRLNHEACEELFDESRRIYERYVFLLRINEFHRVIADTERNMRLFRFVHRHGEHDEDRMNLERWWPYVLRIHGTARAMLAAAEKDFAGALRLVAETRARIERLREVDFPEFKIERDRAYEALTALAQDFKERRPRSPVEQLEKALAIAVQREDFERAALLRDRLQVMRAETLRAEVMRA